MVLFAVVPNTFVTVFGIYGTYRVIYCQYKAQNHLNDNSLWIQEALMRWGPPTASDYQRTNTAVNISYSDTAGLWTLPL